MAILRFLTRIRRKSQGPVMSPRATRDHHVVHLNQFPSNLRGNEKRVIAEVNRSGNSRESLAYIVDKYKMLPIQAINFVAHLAIQPLRCILSIRHPRIVRASGPPPKGGNGRRKGITKNLQVSLGVIQSRTLMGAAGQLGDIGRNLFGDGGHVRVGS